MRTAVQRWGNSLAIRIPKVYAIEAEISEGSAVEMSLKAGALVVRPVRRARHSLGELLKKITAENRHAEVVTGGPVGKEIW